MPVELGPSKLQRLVHRGSARLENFRKARLMFLRAYVGPYYDASHGSVGDESINMVFNAIRVLIPNMVMTFPKHRVESRFLASKEYADLLGMTLAQHDREINTAEVYRRVIVDALFMLGIMKTGLADSGSVYALDEYDQVPVGTVYTDAVDFDNFIVDPDSNDFMFEDAAFMGDKIVVSRSMLLDSGLYNSELVDRLPSLDGLKNDPQAHKLSKQNIQSKERLLDEVEIAEIWIPEANIVVTVPGHKDVTFDDYLRVDDYYGPDTGPYTLLSFSPPVPGNPLPTSMVGMWYDLHTLANQMAKKITDQAMRQKSLFTYRANSADDAEEIRNAMDGDAIGVNDPSDFVPLELGGQNSKNEVYLSQMHNWFNMMAANPQGLAGETFDADSATEARILQGNANIGLEDMKNAVYKAAAREGRARAWYFHVDPLIRQPLTKRIEVPAEFAPDPAGNLEMVRPPSVQEVQVLLTPEVRSGDFLDFTFSIEPESMGRKDSRTRYQEAMEFAVKIMPAAVSVAQSSMMLGIPFDVQAYLVRMARDVGIDWLDQVFYDPRFQQSMMMRMMMGPQAQNSQGSLAPNAGASPAPVLAPAPGLAAILQNGQPGQVGSAPGVQAQERQQAQQGANDAQSAMRTGGP